MDVKRVRRKVLDKMGPKGQRWWIVTEKRNLKIACGVYTDREAPQGSGTNKKEREQRNDNYSHFLHLIYICRYLKKWTLLSALMSLLAGGFIWTALLIGVDFGQSGPIFQSLWGAVPQLSETLQHVRIAVSLLRLISTRNHRWIKHTSNQILYFWKWTRTELKPTRVNN